PLLFPYLNPCPTSVHAASFRQELRQGHRHPRTTTQPDRLCSQSLFFLCLFQFQTKLLRKLERSPKAKKLTTRQVQPSQASMSTALVQPPTPNHTLSVGTMTECLFFFCKLSCQCSLHDNAPLRRGKGGVLSYAQTLASFPGTSFQTFRNPAHFQVYQSPGCQSIKVALSPPQPLSSQTLDLSVR
ncbi:uncharacterized protein CLUP02_07237, partial [Colletotrichum lupini]